jgi:hypothetical protein
MSSITGVKLYCGFCVAAFRLLNSWSTVPLSKASTAIVTQLSPEGAAIRFRQDSTTQATAKGYSNQATKCTPMILSKTIFKSLTPDPPHTVQVLGFLQARMMREICSALPLAGDAGLRRLSELRSSYDPWLKCVFPVAAEAVNEMEGFAAWMVDKAVKNCLDVMWRIRESIVGRLNVTAGKLVVSGRGERRLT